MARCRVLKKFNTSTRASRQRKRPPPAPSAGVLACSTFCVFVLAGCGPTVLFFLAEDANIERIERARAMEMVELRTLVERGGWH